MKKIIATVFVNRNGRVVSLQRQKKTSETT